jgi:nucleoid-associated protein YgaU
MASVEQQIVDDLRTKRQDRAAAEAKRIDDEKQAAEVARAAAAEATRIATEAAAAAERSAAEAAAAQAAVQAAEAKPAEPAEEGKAKEVAFKAIGVDEFGVIIGIAGAAGDPTNLDLDGEYMEKGDLARMAHSFVSSSTRTFKANHKDEIGCNLVESWVGAPIVKGGSGGMRMLAPGERITRETNIVGINVEKGNESHWFVAVRPTDPEVVAKAKAGKIAGFSWGAHVSKTKVS